MDHHSEYVFNEVRNDQFTSLMAWIKGPYLSRSLFLSSSI